MLIEDIIRKDGLTEGLVAVLRVVEGAQSFRVASGTSVLPGMNYYWVADQAEYATDSTFTDRKSLQCLYPKLLGQQRDTLSSPHSSNVMKYTIINNLQKWLLEHTRFFVSSSYGRFYRDGFTYTDEH